METLSAAALDAVATALEYPTTASAERIRFGLETLADADRSGFAAAADVDRSGFAAAAMPAPMLDALEELTAYLAGAPDGEPEERYTALFDLNPVCTLNAGYHIFGEDYRRGELLAGLSREVREAGLPETGEIPDFLPTLLRLLARTAEAEARAALVDALLLPALFKMNEALGSSDSPWAAVVRALPALLKPLGSGEDFAERLFAPAPPGFRAYTEAADLPQRSDRHLPAFQPPRADAGPEA